jgi:hypothetical protein
MADIQKRIAQLQAVRKKTKSEAGKKAIDSKIAKLEAQGQEAKVEKPVEKEVEAPVEKPKKERKPRAKAEPKAKPKKASRFVFEKPVDGGKEVKVVEAMTEAEAKEAMDGTDFEFVKQITRGRSPREGFVADKKAPAKKKEAEKPKRKARASKDERTSMAKAAGMSETRAKKISEKVATGKKRGRKPMDKEAWLFEMPLKTQAGKVKRKIVKATNEKAAIKSAGTSYKLVRKLSQGESPKVGTMEMEGYVAPPKRGRGRPKGAKNKVKASAKPSRMPSKKSQAAIKAKSEDIGEGIAIADKVSKMGLRMDVASAMQKLQELSFRYNIALQQAEKVFGNLQDGEAHLNDVKAALMSMVEDDKKMAEGGVISESKLKKMLRDDDMEWSSDKEFFEVATNAGYDYDQDEEGWREMDSFNEGPYGDYAKGGTTEGKPKVESLEEVFFLMDGTEVAYDDMDDAEKMFGGDPLTPQELVDKLAVDHDIYVMDAAPQLFDLPDGDDEDDDEFYTGDVKDGVTIDDIEDAIEDQLEADNSYNYSAPFVFDVRFTKTRDAYDPQIMLVREHFGGDVRGNYGDYKAFLIDADTNPFYGHIEIDITTNKGHIGLRAETLESYNFEVISDETGTFEDDSTIDRNDIADAFDFGKVKSKTFYIND